MVGLQIGARLRLARHAAGMSQQQLADVIGSHVMVVSSWERDKSTPSADSLDALAGALGVSVDYLLGRTNDPAGVIMESDLSDAERRILALIRRRDVPALLRVVTDIAEDTQEQGIVSGDQPALDQGSGGAGQ